jgi:WD40 repeat protein
MVGSSPGYVVIETTPKVWTWRRDKFLIITAKLEPSEPPIPAEPITTAALVPPILSPVKSITSSLPDFALGRTFKGHSSWVTSVAFSADGQRLASGSWDQTVKFWDVSTGRELITVASKMKEVQALALSRDGHWLAAENSSNTVTIWDATTGREKPRMHLYLV